MPNLCLGIMRKPRATTLELKIQGKVSCLEQLQSKELWSFMETFIQLNPQCDVTVLCVTV
jgi:hypothetical protein